MTERAPVAWPIAAGLILSGVLLLIVAGLFLTRRDAGEPVQVAVPTAAAARPTAAAAVQVAAPTADVARPTALTPVHVAEAGPVVAPTAVPTPAGVSAQPQGESVAVAWWEAERPAEATLSEQVLQAYNQFWQIRSQALLELDPSQLVHVTAGPVLDGERRAIETLRAQNRAQQVEVEHNARILFASADEAAVEDHYVSHTVLVDAASKAPIEPPPSTSWRLAYRLQKIDGVWKVVESVRVRYAQP